MFDRVHSNRETVVICTPSSPARPLEPYDAFYMAMEGQQLLDRGQRKIVQQHPFANEPSSPTTKPAALYSEIAKSHPLAQSSSPSLSAPASPRLTWEVWSGCQGSFSNGKFLGNQPSAKDEIASAIDVLSRTPTEGRQALQGTLSDGEILDDSKLAKKEPVSMVELEHDFAFLGSLSDGEFLHLARRTKECPSPRLRSLPSLRRVPGYDAFEFQGTLSDGEFSNSGRRTIDITAIRQTPTLKPETTKRVYISPILEQNGFEGSLSDGEFWNSGRYFGGECGPPREAFSTASGLRGGVSLSSPGDVEIEALSTGEIEATIVQVNEEIVMLNNELTHRYRTRYNASAAEPLTDPVPHLPSIPESLYLGPTNYTVDKTAAAHFAETTVHCSHGSENYGFDDGFMLPPPLFDTLTDSSARQTQEHVERSQSLRGQRSLLIDPYTVQILQEQRPGEADFYADAATEIRATISELIRRKNRSLRSSRLRSLT